MVKIHKAFILSRLKKMNVNMTKQKISVMTGNGFF
jgi:hypothetical protein